MKFINDYQRRISHYLRFAPTEEEMAEYERVKAVFETIKDSPYLEFEDGAAPTVRPPYGRVEIVYSETEEEWRARLETLPKTITIPVYQPKPKGA